jgi:hypothetical protein
MNRLAACLLIAGPVLCAEPSKTFSFEVFDQVNVRKNPTTQIAIRIAEWPGQRFLLWLPEAVAGLWVQWDPAVAHQEFHKTERGGLRWAFDGNPKARITAELIPREQSLLLEVRVKNRTHDVLEQVSAQNCLPLSEAPDFVCTDHSRLYLRTGKRWRSIADLGVTDRFPMFYRPGFLESGKLDSWRGNFKSHNQAQRADHPLMVVLSKDHTRAFGTVSEDYQCLFHNQGLPYLRCAHSQQAPVERLAPGSEAVFRQMVYFIDGGIKDVLRAYERDVKAGVIKR